MDNLLMQSLEYIDKPNHLIYIVISFSSTIILLLFLYFYSRAKLKKAIRDHKEISENLKKDN